MKNKILLIVMTLFFWGISANARSIASEADSAYNAKDYVKAVTLYTTILESEGSSAALLFNLGNAYFQEGDFGNAMLCWQRARRLNPGDSEINTNIRYLQSRVEDANKAEQKGKRLKTTPDEPSFFQNVYSSIAENTSSNTWGVTAAVLFVLFVAMAALYIFSRDVIYRKIGFFAGFILIAFSIMFVIFSFMAASAADSHDKGVLTAFKTTLLTEPGKTQDANKSGILTKGTCVQILSEEVDAEGKVTWYKVRLNSDYIGWVSASDMEVI